MPDWKILLTDGLQNNGQAILRAAADVDDRDGISGDDLLKVAGNYDAYIVRGRTKVTAAVIKAAPSLKVIGRVGVGVDNIDIQATSEYGVTVVNTPTATSLAVAELTIGLLFTLARSIPHADSSMKDGAWIKKQLCGVELKGKTLGIIGIGNIGSIVADRAASLKMDVIGNDILTDDETKRNKAYLVPLNELYARSDFISLHIPLTAETGGMIDAFALSQMKPGVRLVCTARGGIIDEDALLTSLESGQVAAAALDVFAKEPPGSTALITHPSVIATPHIGAQTAEAQTRAAAHIADEVLAALRGESLRSKVV